MIKELIKLADFLDQKNRTLQASQIDLMIKKLSTNPKYQGYNEFDESGIWDADEYLPDVLPTEEIDRYPDLPTEELARLPEMPTEEVELEPYKKMDIKELFAVRKFLSRFDQKYQSAQWFNPQGAPSYWKVKTVSRDGKPSEWAFWEVFQGDENYGAGEEIPGRTSQMYGEW